jgi:hypothetical protein
MLGISGSQAQLYPVGLTDGNAGLASDSINGGAQLNPPFPSQQIKPDPFDNAWWMYGWYWSDTKMNLGETGIQLTTSRQHRGYTSDRVYFIPDSGWASGDELTDTDTGDVFFLVMADYHGILVRFRLTTNVFKGGIAIREA